MQYDPVKQKLGKVFNKKPFLRKLFYHLLDLLLLRTWHVHKAIKHWAKENRNSPVAILDAGAGFGQYTYYLSSLNKMWTIKAVDVKKEQVDDCNRFFSQIGRNNVSFAEGDLTKFVEPNSFDFILSVDVMEHIADDKKVFENFFSSLKKDGILLIATPSDQGGSDVHDHQHESSFVDEHVRDGYNIDSIQEMLKRTGFSRVEATYTYGMIGQLSWRLSMKYPILLLGVSKLFFILLPFYYLITFPFALLFNCIDVHCKSSKGTGLIVKATK